MIIRRIHQLRRTNRPRKAHHLFLTDGFTLAKIKYLNDSDAISIKFDILSALLCNRIGMHDILVSPISKTYTRATGGKDN